MHVRFKTRLLVETTPRCFLVPELLNAHSKERAVKARLARGSAWVEFALLERVGVNAALYNSLKTAKENRSGEGHGGPAPVVLHALAGPSRSRTASSETEGINVRRSKRLRVA